MKAENPGGFAAVLRLAGAIPEARAAAALLLLAVGCSLVLLAVPRAALPDEMPGLRLPARDVQAVLDRDAAAARTALPGKEAARLEGLMLLLGRYEKKNVPPSDTEMRLRELRDALGALRKLQGEKAVDALRARAVARLQSALELELPEEQIQGTLGSFPAMLKKYGATRDGELVAPWFVVRTMYKARWNLLHGMVSTEAMERTELLALFGWVALQADRASARSRKQALARYAELGGQDADEAQGVFSYLAGDFPAAERFLRTAYERRPSWRLRNLLLGVRAAGGE